MTSRTCTSTSMLTKGLAIWAKLHLVQQLLQDLGVFGMHLGDRSPAVHRSLQKLTWSRPTVAYGSILFPPSWWSASIASSQSSYLQIWQSLMPNIRNQRICQWVAQSGWFHPSGKNLGQGTARNSSKEFQRASAEMSKLGRGTSARITEVAGHALVKVPTKPES
jgi:hypothetical protein